MYWFMYFIPCCLLAIAGETFGGALVQIATICPTAIWDQKVEKDDVFAINKHVDFLLAVK